MNTKKSYLILKNRPLVQKKNSFAKRRLVQIMLSPQAFVALVVFVYLSILIRTNLKSGIPLVDTKNQIQVIPQKLPALDQKVPTEIEDTTTRELSILFAGDIMEHQLQLDMAYDAESEKYNFNEQFKYIKDWISSADISVANLETTLGGKPYQGYPLFSAPDELATALKYAGFNYIVTASNHAVDRNEKGLLNTIKMLDQNGISHTGTFANKEDYLKNHPLYIEKNGFKIGMINYTQSLNGIAVPQNCFVNMIDTAQMAKDIDICFQNHVDVIVAFMHWGDEYVNQPNEDQKQIAQFLVSKGVRIIIGSHPHVIQSMQCVDVTGSGKNNAFVAYSLGNFIANYPGHIESEGGTTVKLRLTKKGNGPVEIQNAGYMLVWVYRQLKSGMRNFYVVPALEFDKKPLQKGHNMLLASFLESSHSIMNSSNIGVGEYIFDSELKTWSLQYKEGDLIAGK